jgi:hypothetical protein
VSDMCLTKAGDGLTGGLVLSSPEFTPSRWISPG